MVSVEVIEFVEWVELAEWAELAELAELAEFVQLKPETGTGADSEMDFQYIFGWEEVGEGCGEYEEE
jgi:hypothetical protein